MLRMILNYVLFGVAGFGVVFPKFGFYATFLLLFFGIVLKYFVNHEVSINRFMEILRSLFRLTSNFLSLILFLFFILLNVVALEKLMCAAGFGYEFQFLDLVRPNLNDLFNIIPILSSVFISVFQNFIEIPILSISLPFVFLVFFGFRFWKDKLVMSFSLILNLAVVLLVNFRANLNGHQIGEIVNVHALIVLFSIISLIIIFIRKQSHLSILEESNPSILGFNMLPQDINSSGRFANPISAWTFSSSLLKRVILSFMIIPSLSSVQKFSNSSDPTELLKTRDKLAIIKQEEREKKWKQFNKEKEIESVYLKLVRENEDSQYCKHRDVDCYSKLLEMAKEQVEDLHKKYEVRDQKEREAAEENIKKMKKSYEHHLQIENESKNKKESGGK